MKMLTLAGQQYPVSFNMAAFLELETFFQIPMERIIAGVEKLDAASIAKLQYLGLKFGAEATSRQFSMTYSAFTEIMLISASMPEKEALTNCIVDEFQQVMTILQNKYQFTLPTKQEEEQSVDVEVQKKTQEQQSGVTTVGSLENSDGVRNNSGEQDSVK